MSISTQYCITISIYYDDYKLSVFYFVDLIKFIDVSMIICLYFYFFAGIYWSNNANQKRILMDFAQLKGFDPFDAQSWYTISVADFIQFHQVHSTK